MEYPERTNGFAFEFLRGLFRSGVITECGPTVLAILMRVCDQENANFWERPAFFFPEDLCHDIGVKRDAMMKARRIAVTSGWLHYEKGVRGRPGKYWVVNRSEMPTQSQNGEANGSEKPHYRRSMADLSPTQSDFDSSLQTRNPKTKKRKPGNGRFDPLSVEVPGELDTETFHVAWTEWFQYRHQRRLAGYTEMGTIKQLGQLVQMGPERAVAAINHSIAANYQGIFEPKASNGRPKSRESTRI